MATVRRIRPVGYDSPMMMISLMLVERVSDIALGDGSGVDRFINSMFGIPGRTCQSVTGLHEMSLCVRHGVPIADGPSRPRCERRKMRQEPVFSEYSAQLISCERGTNIIVCTLSRQS